MPVGSRYRPRDAQRKPGPPPKTPTPKPAPHLSEHGLEAQSKPSVRGMVASGNIDVHKRPVVHNPDGSYSTVRSISVGVGKHTVLIPTVIGKRVVSNEAAIRYFQHTGQHLGVFDNYENADRYAQSLHEAQAREYASRGEQNESQPNQGNQAAGGAVLARGTFQPSNRRQQAELSQGVRQNAAEQQRRRLQVSYDKVQSLREKARQAGAGKTVALLDKRLTALQPHLEAAGVAPRGGRTVQDYLKAAEKVPVAGQLLSMVDPFVAAKAIKDAPGNVVRNVERIVHPPRLKTMSRAEALRIVNDPKTKPTLGIIQPGRVGKSEIPEGATPKPEIPTEEAAAAKVRESLGSARARRAAQEGLYREERGKRIGRAQSASERAGGGEAGFAAAKEQLRGELPKVKFEHLREGKLSQPEFESLLTQVQNHPDLRWFDKIHAQQGLADVFREGKTPQKSQIKHFQTVFGQDAATAILKTSKRVKAGRIAMKTLNMPRELMASFDLSAPFRQGLVAGVSHPGMFFKNFAPMVKAAGSENYYRAMMDSIESRPNIDLYHESGLKLTDLSKEAGHREEQFPESYAEQIPVAGRGIRASGRAYTGFLNKMRADMFDHLLEKARKQGVNVEDRNFQRGLATYINSATGRGSLGPAEHLGPALNTFFFSPRLMASRINFLDPTWYARLDPFARKQALKSAGKLAAFGAGAGALGAAAGGKIGTDPRSSDFGKVKFGNTRLDPLGGFSQYLVAGSRIASGQSISSTSGQVMKLGPGMAQLSRKDIAERFFAGKATPAVSAIYDILQGKDFQGQPLSVKNEVLNRVIPLAIQDAYSLESDTKNIPLGVAGYAAAGLGIGLQTYGPKQLKPNTGKFHDKRVEYLDAAKKAGLLPKGAAHQPAEVRRAFALRESREIAYAKAGGHTLDQRGRFRVDQELLLKRKILTPAKVAAGEKWAKTASDKEIAAFRRKLGDKYFGTLTLELATRQINANGGDVSLR